MGRIGLSKTFFLAKDLEWEGSFVMQHKNQISKDGSPCNQVQTGQGNRDRTITDKCIFPLDNDNKIPPLVEIDTLLLGSYTRLSCTLIK